MILEETDDDLLLNCIGLLQHCTGEHRSPFFLAYIFVFVELSWVTSRQFDSNSRGIERDCCHRTRVTRSIHMFAFLHGIFLGMCHGCMPQGWRTGAPAGFVAAASTDTIDCG
mmetsp:Transcript_94779/g.198011  ORF Transcript_94779/g.198011 Transcript_94779/m.198011 type:complete len:112 (+) Transcript_94779:1577-1912(+)